MSRTQTRGVYPTSNRRWGEKQQGSKVAVVSYFIESGVVLIWFFIYWDVAASQAVCGAQTRIQGFLTEREKLEHPRKCSFPSAV